MNRTNPTVALLAAAALLSGSTSALAGEPPNPATASPTPKNEAPAAQASPDPAPSPQTTSLLGRPLFAPALPEARRGQLEADAEIARLAHDANPSDESAAILYGRRLAYLGRFSQAVDVYTRALADHPDSYRLLRHRGHRYITLRRFDAAIADLSRAWTLAKDRPDAPEIDALAGGASGTTDKSNILYHLGLAQYLKGDFASAAATFAERTGLAARNEKLSDDNTVTFMFWQYLSLRRAGRADEAKAVLAEYSPRMKVQDNDAYFALIRVFAGDVPAEVLASAAETSESANLAMAYGVGVYRLLNGRNDEAMAMFSKLASNPNWPSFGVIAAEAEVARQQAASVPTP